MGAERRGAAVSVCAGWGVVLAGLLVSGCGESVSDPAPEGIQLREAPCGACEIELVPVAELGSDEDPSSVGADAMVFPCAATSMEDGGFAVSRLTGGGDIGVYDSAGVRVGTVGRPGEGPGELGRDLRVLPRPGGGLIVIDNGNLRVAVFDTVGDEVRAFKIPKRAMSHALLDDGLLIHTRPAAGTSEEELFELYDLDGLLRDRFGEADTAAGELDQWIVSAGSSGGFLASSIWEYEVWSRVAPDSLRWRASRSPDWFPGGGITPDDLDGLYVESPPPPVMTHLLDRGDGLIWVFAMVPDRNWEPGPQQAVTPEWARSTLDMMVEVVDPATARVLATLRYDEVLAPMCNGETLYTVRRAPSGDTRLVVLEPRLSGWPE